MPRCLGSMSRCTICIETDKVESRVEYKYVRATGNATLSHLERIVKVSQGVDDVGQVFMPQRAGCPPCKDIHQV